MGLVRASFAQVCAILCLGLALSACQAPVAVPTVASNLAPNATSAVPTGTSVASNPFAGVPGLVDPNNLGWPREVAGLNGRVVIASKPQRVITLSVGHDEVSYALLPACRIVGVKSSTKNPDYSNVAALAKGTSLVTKDPELVVAQRPDLVVATPYISVDTVNALERASIPVMQTSVSGGDMDSRIYDVLLFGYMFGEEQRAIAVAGELRARLDALRAKVAANPAGGRVNVLSLSRYADKMYTAGRETIEGNVIELAGGSNSAAAAGITGFPAVSVESIIALNPQVIILTQSGEGGESFRADLLANPALAGVSAITNMAVHVVGGKYFTTLSFWNLRGAEALSLLLRSPGGPVSDQPFTFEGQLPSSGANACP